MLNRRLPLLFTCFLAIGLMARLVAQDSLNVDLSAVTVKAFRSESGPERVAASVATLGQRAIETFPGNDLLPALNTVAGVRFEQRAPGSYRVSVRGSTLRSPFGVRNLKVYWNGIPLTEPGGDTQLNFLDAANVDRAEVIKGPAGSLYGAGTAGTLLLSTDTLADKFSAEVNGGSYGFFRALTRVQGGKDSAPFQARYALQRTDGYRDHSGLFRQTAEFSQRFRAGEKRSLRLSALYTDLRYDLPGGLNADQRAEDRRQARPGSAETNASINYHNALVGLSQDWQSGQWQNESTVYVTGFYFDHPFNFDYKRETNLGTGGRTTFDRTFAVGASALKLSAGGEYQLQYRMANNFGNEMGEPADLNFSDEIDSRQGLLFAQADLSLSAGWRLTAGLSANRLRYRVDRTFDADGAAGLVASDFGAALSPRLALLKELPVFNLYASVAEGFSPPTLDEFRTNEGSLNADLAPERGVNYEFGLKSKPARLFYELAVYQLNLRQSITTFSDDRGTRLFRNAGGITQRGLELSVGYVLSAQLRLSANYTLQDFSYGSFERDGADVSGQPLPGSAPHTFNLLAGLGGPRGFYANLHYNFTDAIPLNDANTVFGEAYHLVRARLGWRGARWEVFAVGNNLLDQEMSFGNDLNPRFGGRYFQPAAGVNGSVGLRFQL